eukprot:TRINITY_DN631_c0_g1_i1.p1 TRINITY_DN631_c0_g1~~TRINITY_DN631_c0_g1_i1.p1  ORF type:complete len:193 (-),score=43.06 TRINITY_DN631_c0_g1_i1:67-606(-)
MGEDFSELQKQVKDAFSVYPNFPKENIVFYDIHPLLRNEPARKKLLHYYVEKYKGKVDVIVGLESRGYYFGIPVAFELGIPFVPLRKPGKLPGELYSVTYGLEYGSDTLVLQKDAIKSGQRVAIFDDLMATGGTAAGAVELVKKAGAKIVELTCVVELVALKGRQKLPADVQFFSVLQI